MKNPEKHRLKTSGKESTVSEAEICKRCAGTGLVCGHEPTILSGACCVDYANAVCPDCKGTGRNIVLKKEES
jgi:DnaJ-class molecular chaperone